MTVKWLSVLVALTYWCCCSTRHTVFVACASTRLQDFPLVESNDPGIVPDLVETPNAASDPKPADLNVTTLLAKLGAKFDPKCMSFMAPEHLVPIDDVPFRRNHRGRLVPAGKMPAEIRDMDTKYFTLPSGRRLRTRISGQLRRKIQQYLWGKTMCPVQRKWKDLGTRFWPRWLLEGHCPKGEVSCSVPAGMYCHAIGNQHKTLLRWHCRNSGNSISVGSPSAALQQYNTLISGNKAQKETPKACQWLKVEYPVITECGCGCAPDVSE
ncbi:Noggin,Cystine-knot cytokine [Cinara cedri]|uniref:Noggin,Cystine-knot cytokine n=1 Tax=Cinara cedri TaxID=506608 RepID=A0A5E4MPV1_9HEMI|nr:Noggin,Cystine-knot cytokine [Cinara cedri]